MLTARGNGTINAEPNLLFDDGTNTLSFLHKNGDTTNFEMGAIPPASPSPGTGTVGQFTFIDMVGDDYYTDYGFRLLRGNTGKNANSTIGHRGTGDLEIYCNDAGNVKVSSGDFRLTNRFRGTAGPNNASKSGSTTSGMRFMTNFYASWLHYQNGYTIDTGMSVNQSGGGGAILCIYHHTASSSQNSARMYFIGLHYQGGNISYTEVAGVDLSSDNNTVGSAGYGIGSASFDVSAQNTLVLEGSPGENYWHLIACGNIMV
tara:strand:- start:582 stop:1361 length:780 start_codon:yes stop_codon:yes gene_type:complete